MSPGSQALGDRPEVDENEASAAPGHSPWDLRKLYVNYITSTLQCPGLPVNFVVRNLVLAHLNRKLWWPGARALS